MIRTDHKHFLLRKMQWHREARDGLRDTFFGHEDKIAAGVISGQMELFKVNDDSWLVTQRFPEFLFLWCYQGKGLVRMVDELRAVALANGHPQISFFTPHRAALRALRRYSPRALKRTENGHIQYVIECKGATVTDIKEAHAA
jgi:hypothetical protein